MSQLPQKKKKGGAKRAASQLTNKSSKLKKGKDSESRKSSIERGSFEDDHNTDVH